jgi:hypothetical protein
MRWYSGSGRRLIVFIFLLLCAIQTSWVLAEEISSEYLQAWVDHLTTDVNKRIGDFRRSADTLRRRLEEFRALDSKKSKTKADILRSKRTEDFTLQRLGNIETEIGILQSTLDVANQLQSAATREHIARPLRRTVDAYFSDDTATLLSLTTQLKQGHSLSTGEGGFLEFLSTDGSIFQVGPKSSIQFESIGDAHSDYRLRQGKLHGVFTCIKLQDRPCRQFRVSNSNFTAHSSGSELAMEILDSGEQRIIVLNGNVHLKQRGSDDVIELTTGLMVETTVDGRIQGPFNLDLSWVKRWWE